MPELPGTGEQGPTPELVQPANPVTIKTEMWQMWEQMAARESGRLLNSWSHERDAIVTKQQTLLKNLGVLVKQALDAHQPQG